MNPTIASKVFPTETGTESVITKHREAWFAQQGLGLRQPVSEFRKSSTHHSSAVPDVPDKQTFQGWLRLRWQTGQRALVRDKKCHHGLI
jgi:hypothetical protein